MMYKVVVDTVMLNGEPAGKDCYVADSIELKCGLLKMWLDEDTVMTYPMYRVKSVKMERGAENEHTVKGGLAPRYDSNGQLIIDEVRK